MSSTYTAILSEQAFRRLSESGEEPEESSGWLTVKCGSISSSSSDEEALISIPQTLESVQGLEFLGFSSSAAEEILDAYQAASAQIPNDDILTHAKIHIRYAHDATLDTDDWDGALVDMGLKHELRQNILYPEFAALRRKESAKYWALDTLNARYAFLRSINDYVLEHAGGKKKAAGTREFVSLELVLRIPASKFPPPRRAERIDTTSAPQHLSSLPHQSINPCLTAKLSWSRAATQYACSKRSAHHYTKWTPTRFKELSPRTQVTFQATNDCSILASNVRLESSMQHMLDSG